MEYVLLTLDWPWPPFVASLFGGSLAGVVRPRRIPLPGPLVRDAGRGAVLQMPVVPALAEHNPLRLRRDLKRALKDIDRGVLVAIEPGLSGFADAGLIDGSLVSLVAYLALLEKALKGGQRVEIALVGSLSRGAILLLHCVIEMVRGVNIGPANIDGADILAKELWRRHGVVPRLHNSAEGALRRSVIVFKGGLCGEELQMPQGRVVLDFGAKGVTGSNNGSSLVIKGVEFQIKDRLPENGRVFGQQAVALVEAAMRSAGSLPLSNSNVRTHHIEQTKHRLIEEGIEISAVLANGNLVSADALTPILSYPII